MANPNPHIGNADALLREAREMGAEGVAWQKMLVQLLQANVEATLAVAVEMQATHVPLPGVD